MIANTLILRYATNANTLLAVNGFLAKPHHSLLLAALVTDNLPARAAMMLMGSATH